MTKASHCDGTEARLVTIQTFLNEFDANLAKSALQDAGIACMISHDDCGGMRPHLDMTQGIKLIVRAEDVGEATEVLAGGVQNAS